MPQLIDYEEPAIGSLIPLRSCNADDSGSELIKDLGEILMEKGLISDEMIPPIPPKVLKIKLSEYTDKKPVRKHKDQWIDGGEGIAVIHPETYLPFFFNNSGSKICRLCDDEHSVGDIIRELTLEWETIPEKTLVEDIMKTLLLLEEMDFIEFTG